MITVAYDHQIFALQQFGGISRYICEISSGVAAQAGWAARVIAPLHLNEHLLRSQIRYFGVYVPLRMRGAGRVLHGINTLLEPPLLSAVSADLTHLTYYQARPKRHRGSLVITVHDMIHELFPGSFRTADRTTEYKQRCIDAADKIICVSRSTANDLQRIFNVPTAKIAVIHLGISRSFAQRAFDKSATSYSRRPYLLYVGERRGYKNFARLLQAFGTSTRLHREFDLVAFGAAPFSSEELQLAERLNIRNDALHHVTGDDDALADAYARAHLFVYPSQYEGFGIPPLEAMSCGCPVACSDSSSIPEVVGEAGRYFEPMEVDSIREVIEQLAFDDRDRAALSFAGRMQSAGFSWRRCIEETLAVYRETLRR